MTPAHGGLITSQRHIRPNKLARGMTETLYRHRRGHSDVCNTLAVCGTTDKTTPMPFYWYVAATKTPCSCCGQPSKLLKLNERGRARLARLRRRIGASHV